MTDAPEHLWLLPHDGEQRCWCDHPDPSGMGHEDEADEYVRADLVAALEAENQRLRGVLEKIANYREETHAHDDDMGHLRRCFDVEAVMLLEDIARAALRDTEASHDD